MSNLLWPPTYNIRHSARARYLQLRITPRQGLEIIVPIKMKHPDIQNFLDSKRDWIEKHIARFSQQSILPSGTIALPETISLTALAQQWRVAYIAAHSRLQIITQPQQSLVLLGNISDTIACQRLLMDWIKGKADVYLRRELQQLSINANLPYEKANIREQRTRWGSCSSQQIINLNFKLIFLPENLVKHTLLHELCHTIHLNHGKRFWRLLATLDTHCEEHAAHLRKAQKFVPEWIEM